MGVSKTDRLTQIDRSADSCPAQVYAPMSACELLQTAARDHRIVLRHCRPQALFGSTASFTAHRTRTPCERASCRQYWKRAIAVFCMTSRSAVCFQSVLVLPLLKQLMLCFSLQPGRLRDRHRVFTGSRRRRQASTSQGKPFAYQLRPQPASPADHWATSKQCVLCRATHTPGQIPLLSSSMVKRIPLMMANGWGQAVWSG